MRCHEVYNQSDLLERVYSKAVMNTLTHLCNAGFKERTVTSCLTRLSK